MLQKHDRETTKEERIYMPLTLKPCRKGFRSFISAANDTRPSPLPSEAGNTSKTIISKSLVSKGSASSAKNPGFKTAHTCRKSENMDNAVWLLMLWIKLQHSIVGAPSRGPQLDPKSCHASPGEIIVELIFSLATTRKFPLSFRMINNICSI